MADNETKAINEYGDCFRPTNDGHGVDISSQRQDDLDIQSLSYIVSLKQSGRKIIALDLGGGYGVHSVRMAQAGATVTMIDISDMASTYFEQNTQNGDLSKDKLSFVQKDFVALSDSDIPNDLDLVYSQRAIHYVPYLQAKKLLAMLFNHMTNGGMVFISAAGFDTEYGQTYPDRHQALENRFNFVSLDMQVKHGITHKIVTYTKANMIHLLQESGFSPVSVHVSSFGNIKAIGQKTESFKP